MAILVVMPRLSPTMEEGVLAKWLKNEGERITPGDVIAEVETDKANMDFPLEDEGFLLKKLVSEGATIKLGAPVAILGDKGEDISEMLKQQLSMDELGSNKSFSPKQDVEKNQDKQEQKVGNFEEQKNLDFSASSIRDKGRIKISPLARKIAESSGIDVNQISGTGPGGRIVKKDVEAFSSAGLVKKSMPPLSISTDSSSSKKGNVQEKPDSFGKAKITPLGNVKPLSMMRKTIARRLTEAKQLVPHFYLVTEARVDELWKFRESLNQSSQESLPRISVNDLVIKAVARALKVVPEANSSYNEEGIITHPSVDIGVAVSIVDGLITPVVRSADQKSVGAISKEIRELAALAQQKNLAPHQYQGATFSVSNLGMYGIREFSAIINPPESGILAVGSVEKRPAVIEKEGMDTLVVQRKMTLTLSCDHRVIDGVLGAKLLQEIKAGLEQPILLIM